MTVSQSVSTHTHTHITKITTKFTFIAALLKVNGKFIETTLVDLTVEEYGRQHASRRFDTVIMTNVMVFAQDALALLTTLHTALKIGGLLIFHERWFDNHAKSSHCKTAGFQVQIVQANKSLLDHFLSAFSSAPWVSTNQTEGQLERSVNWCRKKDDERGYFAAVRKIK